MSNQIGGSRMSGLLPAQIGEFRRSMSGGAFGPPMGQPYMENQPMGQPYMPGTSLPGMGPPAGIPSSEMNGPPAGMPSSEMNGLSLIHI